MNKYLNTLIMSALFTVLPLDALEFERSHGSWISGIIYTDSGMPIYRAVSGVERKTDVVVYFAVDIANDCRTINPNLLLYMPDGVDGSGYLNLGEFKARVDTREIIEGAWTSSANNMGDNVIFVSLYTDKQVQLLSHIKIGNTLRIKIEFIDEDGDEFYLNFSLKGSSAAINRASALCLRQLNSDKKYFEQSVPNQSDPSLNNLDYFF